MTERGTRFRLFGDSEIGCPSCGARNIRAVNNMGVLVEPLWMRAVTPPVFLGHCAWCDQAPIALRSSRQVASSFYSKDRSLSPENEGVTRLPVLE